jgi:hypothetical protein
VTQSFDQKCEALKTLLPLMWTYLSRMPEARVVRRYGQAKIDPGKRPPEWSLLDCDGRCTWCEWEHDCGGEWWEYEMHQLERQYRVLTIAAVFARLAIAAPQLADAVRWAYVEDHDPTLVFIERNPMRHKWAEAGVRWIARKIPGELTPYYEKPKTTTKKVEELLDSGLTSSFFIACRIGCHIRRVQQIRRALKVRCESALSAVG